MNFLITGISGAGKSTLSATLSSLGYDAVDVDTETDIAGSVSIHTQQREVAPEPPPEDWRPNHQWLWDSEKLKAFLNSQQGYVFLCGNSENQTDYYSFFTKIFVLIIDNATLTNRLSTRTNNSYGKHSDELAAALDYSSTFTQAALDAGAIPIDATLSSSAIAGQIISACYETK